MGDILRDHGLAQAVGADECEIAALADEFEGERTLDESALDLLGPVPVEIGDWLEASEAGSSKAALLAAPAAVDFLEPRDLLQHLHGRKTILGGARHKVIERAPDRLQSDLQQAGDRSFTFVVVAAIELIVGLRGMGFDVEVHQIWPAGEVDGQAHLSLAARRRLARRKAMELMRGGLPWPAPPPRRRAALRRRSRRGAEAASA